MTVIGRRARIAERFKYLALAAFAVPWIGVPLWLIIVNSMKPLTEATRLELSLPETWTVIENYTRVIDVGHYPLALRNSVTIVIPTIIVVLLLGSMAAWAFARTKSLTAKVAYNITVLSIVLPPALLPTIFLLRGIEMDGTTLGYILVTVGVRLGIVVFLATGFIRAMPPDLEEAAQIDGASHLQVYRHVILPLLMPVLFVGAVLLVIVVWNEFFFAIYLLPAQSQLTIPLSLFRFNAASATVMAFNWNLIFAHVVLMSLPLIIVYMALQRRVLSGLTEGSLKA